LFDKQIVAKAEGRDMPAFDPTQSSRKVGAMYNADLVQ
jgi:hypothetical protein